MQAHSQSNIIKSGAFLWSSLPLKKDAQRESRKIAEGSTTELSFFEMHATTQSQGATPRPPHDQKDIEELIIIKEGRMKTKIGDKEAILTPGAVLLISPLEMQTFENIGDGPLTYYVFMFRSKKPMDMARNYKHGGSLLLNESDRESKETPKGSTRKFFDRPTAMTENFEIHTTTLNQKGPSHDPHTHPDTEIILVLQGETEMIIDEKHFSANAGDLYFIESNQKHEIKNSSDLPCTYFSFKWR